MAPISKEKTLGRWELNWVNWGDLICQVFKLVAFLNSMAGV